MVIASAAGLAAATVAAELDAQYVKELLEDKTPTDEELDSAFDLSLDDLETTRLRRRQSLSLSWTRSRKTTT